MHDDIIERLIEQFRSLPGVGYKSAQRYAYSILEGSREKAEELCQAIMAAKDNINFCEECGNFTNENVCKICANRSHKVICVVKEPKDVSVMERVKSFDGVYHVLFGTISPLDGRGPDDIRIKELLERVSRHGTEEVIMATNPDVEGDATAMYIAKILSPLGVKVTRLAQGVSMGSDIEYADEVTLERALEARRPLN